MSDSPQLANAKMQFDASIQILSSHERIQFMAYLRERMVTHVGLPPAPKPNDLGKQPNFNPYSLVAQDLVPLPLPGAPPASEHAPRECEENNSKTDLGSPPNLSIPTPFPPYPFSTAFMNPTYLGFPAVLMGVPKASNEPSDGKMKGRKSKVGRKMPGSCPKPPKQLGARGFVSLFLGLDRRVMN